MKEYLLSRKTKGESEWKSSTKGDIYYIITVLKLNLESPELRGREWKIESLEDN